MSDAESYARGVRTLLATWEEYARNSAGASVRRMRGVSAAIFLAEPERTFFNNALLDRGLERGARAPAVDAMRAAYASAGIDRYAAWVHEGDRGMRDELSGRGYVVEETTVAMALRLEDLVLDGAELELGPADWDEYLQLLGVPDLLSGARPDAFRVLVGRHAGRGAVTGMTFDHDGDCGVFNVVTVEALRRRGLGSALTARLLKDAVRRGCTTASLQSTPVAAGVYSALGFRSLGRILEFVPQGARPA